MNITVKTSIFIQQADRPSVKYRDLIDIPQNLMLLDGTIKVSSYILSTLYGKIPREEVYYDLLTGVFCRDV